MKQEDYCSYELAKKLKACGFDEPCIAQWACEPDGKPILVGSTAFVFSNDQLKGRDVTAPLLFHAQKWLREKKELMILIGMTCIDDWFYGIYDKCGKCLKDDGTQRDCYEAALSAGIAAALELIKE